MNTPKPTGLPRGPSPKPATLVPSLSTQQIAARLDQHAVAIRTRARQKMTVTADHEETVYIVRRGVFLLAATLPGDRNQIMSVLFPGDVFHSTSMPPLTGTGVIAASDEGELCRIRWATLKELTKTDPELDAYICHRLIEQTARIAFHSTVVAGLTGEERVAMLYTELALRLGRELPGGHVFEMPLTRMDVADYLALNADTVSRIVSRLRAKGLFSDAGRGRILCRDLEALARESPVAPALERMIARNAA